MLLSLSVLVIVSSVVSVHAAYPPSLLTDVVKLLMDNYCYPKRLEGIPEALEKGSGDMGVLEIPDPNDLASVLTTGMRKTVGDPRLLITYEPNYVAKVHPVVPPLPPEQLINLIKGSIKVDLLENNIGYLRIDHIIGREMAEKIGPLLVENIWNRVLPTSALIFDLRYTSNGELSGVPYIVSYLSDAEPLIHIDTVYNRPSDTTTELWSMPRLLGKRYGAQKDLIILTSRNTKGVAEGVAYAMKNLRRATIVGEKTAGGSVKIEKLKVGDSGFYFSMPTSSSTSPVTSQSWEIVGVTPCVEVNAEDALDAAVSIFGLRSRIPAIVQEASALVADDYAFTEVGKEVSQELVQLLEKGHYRMINSKTELKAQLSADLKELSGDKCLKTTRRPSEAPMPNLTPEMLVAMIETSFRTDVLENNIGYLRFDMFGDFEQVAPVAKIIVERVWNKVVNTNALIIDLRNNVGGHSSTIPGFCSYFFDGDKQIVLDTLYNRPSDTTTDMLTLQRLTGERYSQEKGLVILTSGVTAGAAEEFVYIMKKLGRAMVVGEVTYGGCHPPETFRVRDSDVYLSVPVTRTKALQGPAWEGAGVSPHVPVSADAALDTAMQLLKKQLSGQK